LIATTRAKHKHKQGYHRQERVRFDRSDHYAFLLIKHDLWKVAQDIIKEEVDRIHKLELNTFNLKTVSMPLRGTIKNKNLCGKKLFSSQSLTQRRKASLLLVVRCRNSSTDRSGSVLLAIRPLIITWLSPGYRPKSLLFWQSQ
jgi:hypothetical protein